jgi:hypothetical protein
LQGKNQKSFYRHAFSSFMPDSITLKNPENSEFFGPDILTTRVTSFDKISLGKSLLTPADFFRTTNLPSQTEGNHPRTPICSGVKFLHFLLPDLGAPDRKGS